jgi:hypothetical protein
MPVKISNLLGSGPIFVPLNTGANLRLSPGQTSEELSDVEVVDNAKVEKLFARGVIDIQDVEVTSPANADENAGPAPDSSAEERSEPVADPTGRSRRSAKSSE